MIDLIREGTRPRLGATTDNSTNTTTTRKATMCTDPDDRCPTPADGPDGRCWAHRDAARTGDDR